MDFWSYLLIIGGGGLVVLAISKLAPGLFSAVINIMRSILEFVLHHLPAPAKYALVIALVIAVGSTVVTYTIGLSYVCLNDGEGDAVYKVPIYVGLSMQSWVNLEGDLAKVTVEDMNVRDHNIYEFRDDESDGGEDTFGFYGLVARSDVVGELFTSDWTRVPPKEQFSKVFGDSVAVYDVCYSGDDGSCVLLRRDFTFGTSGAVKCAISEIDRWGQSVGVLKYEMINITDRGERNSTAYDGELQVSFNGPAVSAPYLSWIVTDPNVVCGKTEGELEDFGSPMSLQVVQERWWGDREWDFKVYNADRFPLMRTDKKYADVENGTFFWETPDDVIQEIIAGIFKDAEKVGSQRGDVLKYSCNKDTRDEPFDVNMTMFGINPFDPTVIIFFFLFAGILAIYKYFDR